MVIECVFGTDNGYVEAEVFASFNFQRRNDRTYISESDRKNYFRNVIGRVVDGRLYCEFSVQIIPQIQHRPEKIWNLDRGYFIMAATGTAQPDELNAHDTSPDSFFYPIVSSKRENPSRTGKILYDLSDAIYNATIVMVEKPADIVAKENTSTVHSMAASLRQEAAMMINFIFLLSLIFIA